MTALPLDIRVQDIDHCGIVAGIIDEMGLVEQINRLLGTHPQEITIRRSSCESHDSQRPGFCERTFVHGVKNFL